MYIILVYDIHEKMVSKIMKICRQYLNHIQNSVFEGEITQSSYKEMLIKIHEKLNFSVDSVIIFKLRSDSLFEKCIYGQKNAEISNII